MDNFNTLFKLLDPNKVIQQKLPKIKEDFIEYYGEEYRELIEERLNNMLLIAYQLPDDLKNYVRDLGSLKTEELQKEFLEKIGVEATKENLNIYFSSKFFEYQSLFKIEEIYQYINLKENPEDNSWKFEHFKKNFIENSKKILNDDSIEENAAIAYFKSIKPQYDMISNQYQEYKETMKINVYEEFIKRTEELSEKINQKYLAKFLEKISPHLSMEDLFYIKKCKEEGEKIDPYKLSVYDNLIGFQYTSSVPINAFSSEAESILNNSKNESWRTNSIKMDRINYFKSKGIDLGDKYEEYLKYYGIEKIMPDKNFADQIINIKNELNEAEKIEFLKSTTDYIENRNKINNLNLKDQKDGYNAANIYHGLTCVSPNFINENGVTKPFSLLMFSAKYATEHLDSFLIHELNHIVELNSIEVDSNNYKFKCGWDNLECQIDNEQYVETTVYKHDDRPYESLNEVINELTAQDIHKIVVKNNNYILNDENDTQIKNGSSYESNVVMVFDFYNHFKKDIIKSRLTGNNSELLAKIGADNFETLNSIVTNFNANFKGFGIYNVIASIKKNEETEDTIIYRDLIAKSKKLFANMLEKEAEYKNQSINI